MFNLIVDENLRLRNIHPNDAEALFDLIEQNRVRLRPWIDPYSLPETAKATRLFAVRCLFNFYGDPTEPSELDQYFLELESYFPPLVRPIDLGIWFQDKLVGSVMMSWPEHNASVLEFGYWISAKHEGLHCKKGSTLVKIEKTYRSLARDVENEGWLFGSNDAISRNRGLWSFASNDGINGKDD